MIIGLKEKMKAAGFEPLVFEDAQDMLLDQLNAINGVLNPKTARFAACDHSKQALTPAYKSASGSALR
jgi:hypothetical protein